MGYASFAALNSSIAFNETTNIPIYPVYLTKLLFILQFYSIKAYL